MITIDRTIPLNEIALSVQPGNTYIAHGVPAIKVDVVIGSRRFETPTRFELNLRRTPDRNVPEILHTYAYDTDWWCDDERMFWADVDSIFEERPTDYCSVPYGYFHSDALIVDLLGNPLTTEELEQELYATARDLYDVFFDELVARIFAAAGRPLEPYNFMEVLALWD